jgi:murein DD-endopeptidase MepM/ murein hydrolase activator NlpD
MFASVILPINIRRLWLFNFGLIVLYFSLFVGFPFLKGSVLEYPNAKPAAFDGTVRPIAYVPNWLIAGNMTKSLRYDDIASGDFIELPSYDPQTLEIDSATDKIALMARATFITPYMGSYRMNFKEYDGSHLAIDIRSPLGTPVLSIANGVVIRVVNTENADGKYVIIRHEGVSFNGKPASNYYSSYMHLETSSVTEGTVIAKGEMLGKVGMTGITTTPHLHFQIDNADAPFHAYWPYSFQDLRSLKLDFFEAVNVGLGKENAMKYTVNPMEFVQKLLDASYAAQSPSAPEIRVAASTPAAPQNFVASVAVAAPAIVVAPPANLVPPVAEVPAPAIAPTPVLPASDFYVAPELAGPIAAPVAPPPVVVAPPVAIEPPVIKPNSVAAVRASQAFTDVSSRAVYAKAAAYLKSRSILQLQSESTFRATKAMTRREAVLYLAGVFNIEGVEWTNSPYEDVPNKDPAVRYITAFQANNIIAGGRFFRPDDAITKVELVALLLRITGDYQAGYDRYGVNGALKKFVADTKYTRANISPNRGTTRADAARMIYAWGLLKRG